MYMNEIPCIFTSKTNYQQNAKVKINSKLILKKQNNDPFS